MRKPVMAMILLALFIVSLNSLVIAGNKEFRRNFSQRLFQEATFQEESNNTEKALRVFTKAFRIDNKDSGFREGIVNSQRKLLEKSLEYHNEKAYEEAKRGYSLIINSPKLDKVIVKATQRNLVRAMEEKEIYGVTEYEEEGDNLLAMAKPNLALEHFTEGYLILKEEELLKGIEKSIESLFEAGLKAQAEGNFEEARLSYEGIIQGENEVGKDIFDKHYKDAERFREYVLSSYKTLEIFQLARKTAKQDNLRALSIYKDGLLLAEHESNRDISIDAFSNSPEFLEDLNKCCEKVLEKSIARHKQGAFPEAIEGYEAILNLPKTELIYGKIYRDTLLNVEAAKKGLPFERKVAYLTFDDGPSANTLKILDILARYDIKATFFVTGNASQFGRDVYKRIIEEGHLIGNHSYTHSYKNIYSSAAAFKKDFYRLENLIFDTVGMRPKVIRFPGGSNNTVSHKYGGKTLMSKIIRDMTEAGYRYYDWNVDSLDASKVVQDKNIILSAVLNFSGNKDKVIILMHDALVKRTTVEALPQIIEGLNKQGFTFEILP